MFRVSVLMPAKRVGGFAELWRVRFYKRKAYTRLADVRSVDFDHRKACSRLVELWRYRFDHRKACKRIQGFGVCVLATA